MQVIKSTGVKTLTKIAQCLTRGYSDTDGKSSMVPFDGEDGCLTAKFQTERCATAHGEFEGGFALGRLKTAARVCRAAAIIAQ